MPLNVAIFVFERTTADLEGPKAHTRPYLTEFAGIIRSPDKHVMPDLYYVIHILESDDSTTLRFAFCRWQRGKEVLENLHDSLANWRGETLNDETSATVLVQDKQDVPLELECRIDLLPGFRSPTGLCRCVRSTVIECALAGLALADDILGTISERAKV